MLAMVTYQGTAASETALCDDCFSVTSYYAEQRADEDVDKQRGFVRVDDNDQLECSSCGKPAAF